MVLVRKSPIRHDVSGHYRQGKWVETFERGRGERKAKKSRVVGKKKVEDVILETMPWKELDPDIRSTVKAFLGAGFETTDSCSGHYEDGVWSSGYISFYAPKHRVDMLRRVIKDIPHVDIKQIDGPHHYWLDVYYIPMSSEELEEYGWPKWRHKDMSKKTNDIFKEIERRLRRMV